MIKKVFTVFDSKAEMFLTPFYEITVGQATRAFADVCNDDNHTFNRHPNDFTLFELGTYNTHNGMHLNHKTPVHIGMAIQFIGIDEAVPVPEEIKEIGAKK